MWQELNALLTSPDLRSHQSQPKAFASSAPSRRTNSYETRAAPKPKGCDLCKKENQMTVDERSVYIKIKNLSLNCFARGLQLKDRWQLLFLSEPLKQAVSAEFKKLCQLTIRSPNSLSLHINTTAYALPSCY